MVNIMLQGRNILKKIIKSSSQPLCTFQYVHLKKLIFHTKSNQKDKEVIIQILIEYHEECGSSVYLY